MARRDNGRTREEEVVDTQPSLVWREQPVVFALFEPVVFSSAEWRVGAQARIFEWPQPVLEEHWLQIRSESRRVALKGGRAMAVLLIVDADHGRGTGGD